MSPTIPEMDELLDQSALDMEKRVLAIMVTSTDQERLLPLLSKDFFTIPEHAAAFQILEALWRNYKQIPTESEMRSFLLKSASNLPLIIQAVHLKLVSDIYRKVAFTGASLEELKQTIIRKALEKSLVEAIDSPNPMGVLTGLRQRIDGLSSIMVGEEEPSSCMLSNDYLAKRMTMLLSEPEDLIPLGWPKLDKLAKGGHRRGELVLVAAQISVGKSFTLINIAANAVLQGYRVAYINMDLPTSRIEDRIYSRITGISINEDGSMEIMHQQIRNWMVVNNIHENALAYQLLPPESLRVSSLRGVVRRMDDLYGPRDLVLVDYGDQLLPDNPGGRYDLDMRSVFEGLRGLGRDMDVEKVVVAGTQTNYADWDDSKERTTTIKNLGDSKAKARPAQFGFAIDQSKAEKLNDPPLCRFNVFKNSHGESGKTLHMIIDYAHAIVEEAPAEVMGAYNSSKPGGHIGQIGLPTVGNANYALAMGTPEGEW